MEYLVGLIAGFRVSIIRPVCWFEGLGLSIEGLGAGCEVQEVCEECFWDIPHIELLDSYFNWYDAGHYLWVPLQHGCHIILLSNRNVGDSHIKTNRTSSPESERPISE